ncbi:MAG: NAD(P)H-hydrate dehydratase [Gammaproteobacteria bacterium]|nr:NAD(P)H-hydrate dehydratase [Gammaproteobacteria bacterium]
MAGGAQSAAVLDVAAVRAVERKAIEHLNISGLSLMQRAGAAAWTTLRSRWPDARSVVVVCGPGNNGGDGYVVARHAAAAGMTVTVLEVGKPVASGDAAACRDAMLADGVMPLPFQNGSLPAADIIVDAIFGIGLARPPAGDFEAAIMAINAADAPVFAIDLPSGLNADTGATPGAVVHAACTQTFIALKPGLVTGHGPAVCGEIVNADLDIPAAGYDGAAIAAHLITSTRIEQLLQPRQRVSHKGDFGHVLVIGGAPGFAGAALMSASAAARTGAGLVSVATHPDHAAQFLAAQPELMVHAVAEAGALRQLLPRATVIAVGPGLGQGAWARGLLATALESQLPMVIDADALNLLAQQPGRRENRVLTPHPGEAARLLGESTAQVQQDRLGAGRRLADRYGGTVVLKGAGSCITTSEGRTWICRAGNPGMASGGMGDVLTGIIAGLMAQRLGPDDAAIAGVWLHATAADCAAAAGERGLLATDLLPHVRRLVNP